jgi:hypothetical protein
VCLLRGTDWIFVYNSVSFRPYSASDYCQQYVTAASTAVSTHTNITVSSTSQPPVQQSVHILILLPMTQFGFHKHYVFSLQRNAKLFKLHLERNATKFRRIFTSPISRPCCITTCHRATRSKWHIAVPNKAHTRNGRHSQMSETHRRPVILKPSIPSILYQRTPFITPTKRTLNAAVHVHRLHGERSCDSYKPDTSAKLLFTGPFVCSIGIATRYGLDAPRDRIPLGARFFAPLQTGPGAHPASCTVRTGSYPGVKWPGRGFDHLPHLAPKLEKE